MSNGEVSSHPYTIRADIADLWTKGLGVAADHATVWPVRGHAASLCRLLAAEVDYDDALALTAVTAAATMLECSPYAHDLLVAAHEIVRDESVLCSRPSKRASLLRGVQHVADLLEQAADAKRLLQERYAGVEDSVMHDRVVRVAGHVEHLHFRSHRGQPFGQLPPAHHWHDYVCEQEVNGRCVALTHEKRFAAVPGLKHIVAVAT